MKHHPTIQCLMLLSLMTLCRSIALAQTAPAVGQVSELRGQASVIRTAITPLAVGSDVFQSDVLVTASESFLLIRLGDGSELSLDEGSRLEISELVISPEPRGLLKLVRGRLRTLVSNLFSSRSESFRVQTREGTMGVQGTEFDVHADPRETRVYVYQGLVAAASRDPRFPEATILGPGDWVRIRLGEPLPPPKRFVIEQTTGAQPESGGAQCRVSNLCSMLNDPTAATPEPPHGAGPPLPREPNPPGWK